MSIHRRRNIVNQIKEKVMEGTNTEVNFQRGRGVEVGRGDQGGTGEGGPAGQLVGRNVDCLQQLFEEQKEL